MGTNISDHLYMIATVTAFSLFTAYQFLSPGKLVFTPESKMRPYPSWVNQRLCAYTMEMIATSFFFAYCVSNFECWIYIENSTWQRCDCKLQYNTCGRRMKVFSALPDHMFIISRYEFDHMCWLACSFSVLDAIILCRRIKFRALLPPQKHDHISIIRHSDLTTSLTIIRTGVHGDKMSREYEKAVFA